MTEPQTVLDLSRRVTRTVIGGRLITSLRRPPEHALCTATEPGARRAATPRVTTTTTRWNVPGVTIRISDA